MRVSRVLFCKGVALPKVGVDINIVLVQPNTPWNAGSVGRTCLGYNSTLHLVGPLGFSLEEKDIRRSGLDYWHRVPKHTWNNWEEFKKAKESMDHVYYFSTKAQSSLIEHNFGEIIHTSKNKATELDKQTSVALVFGCESKGLFDIIGADEMKDGKILAIPMNENPTAGFRSYNLSCTVSMVVWDLYKSLHMAKKEVNYKEK